MVIVLYLPDAVKMILVQIGYIKRYEVHSGAGLIDRDVDGSIVALAPQRGCIPGAVEPRENDSIVPDGHVYAGARRDRVHTGAGNQSVGHEKGAAVGRRCFFLGLNWIDVTASKNAKSEKNTNDCKNLDDQSPSESGNAINFLFVKSKISSLWGKMRGKKA